MKRIKYYLLAVSALFLVSCFPSGPSETITEESVELRGTKWQLEDRFNLDAYIEFDEDISKLTGNDGCNSFEADIELKNYFIEFSNFINTEMYCEDLNNFDRDFLVALSKVRDYSADARSLTFHTLGPIHIGEKRFNQFNFKRVE